MGVSSICWSGMRPVVLGISFTSHPMEPKTMPFTNTTAAACGILAMHAIDMFRVGGSLTPPAAPGLTAAGWTIRAYITGNDTLFTKGPLQLKGDVVYYG